MLLCSRRQFRLLLTVEIIVVYRHSIKENISLGGEMLYRYVFFALCVFVLKVVESETTDDYLKLRFDYYAEKVCLEV